MNSRRDPREEEKNRFRLNDMIRIPEARLVGDNLDEISQLAGKPIESGIYPTRQLREWAERLEMDLVEISPNAKPPVVRITDFNKFLYEKKKKEKEIKAKAAKTVIKEIRFGPNTDDHDFEFKVRHARSFLDEGSKVKAYVQFKGRAIVFKDRGELLLLRFLKELEDLGAAESLPKLEGRRMIVMVAPKKSAPKK
jgi:translation initiation factor IF-3